MQFISSVIACRARVTWNDISMRGFPKIPRLFHVTCTNVLSFLSKMWLRMSPLFHNLFSARLRIVIVGIYGTKPVYRRFNLGDEETRLCIKSYFVRSSVPQYTTLTKSVGIYLVFGKITNDVTHVILHVCGILQAYIPLYIAPMPRCLDPTQSGWGFIMAPFFRSSYIYRSPITDQPIHLPTHLVFGCAHPHFHVSICLERTRRCTAQDYKIGASILSLVEIVASRVWHQVSHHFANCYLSIRLPTIRHFSMFSLFSWRWFEWLKQAPIIKAQPTLETYRFEIHTRKTFVAHKTNRYVGEEMKTFRTVIQKRLWSNPLWNHRRDYQDYCEILCTHICTDTGRLCATMFVAMNV